MSEVIALCPPGYDPQYLTVEEAKLLAGTTPGAGFDEYLARNPEKVKWIVEGLVPAGGMSIIYGPPKRARKSFMAIQMGMDIVEGRPFLGRFATNGETKTVIVLQLDTPQSIWKERLENLETAGVILTKDARPRFVNVDQTDIFPLNVLTPKGQAFLRYHVRKFKPDLFIIDVMRKVYVGSEDETDTIEAVMSAAKAACAPAAVLFISHAKKPSQGYDSGTLNELRGSSHIGGSADCVIRIKPPARNRRHTLMCVEGRATETKDYPLNSLPNHFYELASNPWVEAVDKFSHDVIDAKYEDVTSAAKAMMLAVPTEKSEAAYRMAITRRIGEINGDDE